MPNRHLFLSHSSRDESLVTELVKMLEQSLNVTEEIRCTSVPGRQLPIGEFPRDKLVKELRGAVVVPLLTRESIAAPWVLFELGAAWAIKSPVLPIVCGVSKNELPGALNGAIVADAKKYDDMHRLVKDVSDKMKWGRKPPAQIDRAVRTFVSASQQEVPREPAHSLLTRRDVIARLRWGEVAARTKSELYILAWSGTAALNERTRNTILKMLADGKRVKFLILAPRAVASSSRYLDFGPVCSWSKNGVRKDVEKGKTALLKFRSSLSASERKCFETRATSWFMAWSGVAIDPELATGLIQVENYLYNFGKVEDDHLDFRPNLLLTKKSDFYRSYWHSIRELWKRANRLNKKS